MSTERHRATVKISGELLRGIFFPEGTKILAVIEAPKDFYGENVGIIIKIEHPDLPITKENENYPMIEPSYIQYFSGVKGELPTVIFDKWGL